MPTIADVARKAGVSAPHAARVLSGKGYASQAVRERVLRAAEEIDYVPNRLARGLRSRRTDTIGLVISDVENAFYSQIAKNVETEAKERGYHVVLCNSSDDPAEEQHYLTLLEALRVDGVIVTPSPGRPMSLKRLVDAGTVVIQMDRKVRGLKADAVLVANVSGAEAVVDHLVENGHRRIGILNGPRTITTGQQRLSGFIRAMDRHKLRPAQKLMRVGSFQRASAMEDARALLAQRPSAIFATNNILAEAVMLVLREQGARVPEDVSLVAFDDTPWMSLVNPPLTTMRQPTAEMARAAVSLLARRLGDGTSGPETLIFEPELVLRGSVAKLA